MVDRESFLAGPADLAGLPGLAGDRAAVADLLAAADRAATTWSVPRAPGKWSPAQIVEHVACIMDESTKVASGDPSRFPTLPFFLRPIVRSLFFNRALKKNAFPSGKKTIKELDPETGSATPVEARVRLDASLLRFEEACRAIRHHLLQMRAAAEGQ